MEKNLEAKFTVEVGSARAGYELLEDAKKESLRLARLNDPEPVVIEDENGYPLFSFFVKDGEMKMTEISYRTLTVDDA